MYHSGKVKLPLCLIRHLAMKAYGKMVAWLHALLTLTTDAVIGQIHTQKGNV